MKMKSSKIALIAAAILFSSSVFASLEDDILAEYRAEQKAALSAATATPTVPQAVAAPAICKFVTGVWVRDMEALKGAYVFTSVYGGNTYQVLIGYGYVKVARKGYAWYKKAFAVTPHATSTVCELNNFIKSRLSYPSYWKYSYI